MSPNHPYQVMPKPSPEDRAALKASIDADGVRVPIDVDEEGTILDGHQRQEICDELKRECPKRVITGLTEAQKIEYAWQVNVVRRQLSKAQKRQLAEKLWHDGQTQERIAQLLGVTQPTIANWVREFIKSDKLPPSPTVEGKDGKHYPRTKTQRRTTHPTEEADITEIPQIPSNADDGPAQAPEQQEPPEPRDTYVDAELPSTAPAVPLDISDAPETPSLVSNELLPAPREPVSSAIEPGQVPSADDDAEAHWVSALQDLAARLEALQAQDSQPSLSRRWPPETRALCMATIRRMQETLMALEVVVGVEIGEAADRNGHDDVDATPPPVLPPIADEVQQDASRERTIVPPAETPIGDLANGDQLPLQWDGGGNPPRDQVVPIQEEDEPSTQILPIPPSRPARTRTRRSGAKGSAASTIGDLTGPIPGASATLTEISGRANDADPVEPCSPDMLLNTHYPNQECPEPSSGSQEACLDGALRLNNRTLIGSAGAGDPPTANVPMTASAAPLPLCPECGLSNTWHIYGAGADRFACLNCSHHFNALTPGDVPSTPTPVASHEIVQVASEEKPQDSRARNLQQHPPMPVPAADSITQEEINPGASEVMASPTTEGGSLANQVTAPQMPPAESPDDGETDQRECREVA